MELGPFNWPREIVVWLLGNLVWMVVVFMTTKLYARIKKAEEENRLTLLGVGISGLGTLLIGGWVFFASSEPIADRYVNAGAFGLFSTGVLGMFAVSIFNIATHSRRAYEAEYVFRPFYLSTAFAVLLVFGDWVRYLLVR